MDRPARLAALASELAARTEGFQVVRGAGEGDHATLAFMRALRLDAITAFGEDLSERRICGDNSFAVDFYFPEVATIVEIALGLQNPASEFEKDILKAFMAREAGFDVRRLLFISRAGGVRKCNQPGRAAVRDWAEIKHALAIEIKDLPGEPRQRQRRGRAEADPGAPVA